MIKIDDQELDTGTREEVNIKLESSKQNAKGEDQVGKLSKIDISILESYRDPVLYLIFEKKQVKNLFLFIKYGNDLLRTKVKEPHKIIDSFLTRFIVWTTLCTILPCVGVLLLPRDIEPANYLKIGAVLVFICIQVARTGHFLSDNYPEKGPLKFYYGQLISQSESISILVCIIWCLILSGISVYHSFSKLEKRNKFFRGLRNLGRKKRRQKNRRRNMGRRRGKHQRGKNPEEERKILMSYSEQT